MSSMIQDLRFAFRTLRKRPAGGIVIVLTLGLGIGINILFFASFYAMVLRPLPFEDPDRLVDVNQSQPELVRTFNGASIPNFLDWKDRNSAFERLAAYRRANFNLQLDDRAEQVRGSRITADLFPMLGVGPALGRNFVLDEDGPRPARVALISDSLWKSAFGADPRIVGRECRLDGEVYEIVGVMEPRFAFPFNDDLWVPLEIDRANFRRDNLEVNVLGRLRRDIPIEEAQQSMAAVAAALEHEYPDTNRGWSVTLLGLHEAWMPPITRVAAFAMQGLVTLVLLIMCANVANMVLAQASVRRHERVMRIALGASRGRLIRQALIESAVLAVLGAGVGFALVLWVGDWPARISAIPIPYWLTFGVDGTTIVFAALIACATAIAIGLFPAFRATNANLFAGVKSGGRGGGDGSEGGRLRSALVVAEYALAVVVLVGSLLMVNSYRYLQTKNPGFEAAGVVVARLALNGEDRRNLDAGLSFLQRVEAAVRAEPGVENAAFVNVLPISRQGYGTASLDVDGLNAAPGEEPLATFQMVSESYFETARIDVLEGRVFHHDEVWSGLPVVLVGQSLADRVWPRSSAIGRRLRLEAGDEWLRVVGTVATVDAGEAIAGVNSRPEDQLYLPLAYSPGGGYELLGTAPNLVLRSGGDVEVSRIADRIRGTVFEIDPRTAVFDVMSMENAVTQYYFAQQIWSWMFSIIAVVAMVIAAIGAYGVSAYSVSRRVREIGIRTALGARPGALVRAVVGSGVAVAGLGLTIGMIAAVPVALRMKDLLHGIEAFDPAVMFSVIGLLLLVAVLACAAPARRAATVDPVIALRDN